MTGTVANGPDGWVGRTLDDRYRIDRILGEGGMGAVFTAHQLRLDKAVALKIILPEHAGNAELATRFAREAMLTAKIDHPHVVSAIDTGPLPGGGAYLVMQLAKGKSLRALVAKETGWRTAAQIGAQIADALTAAHAIGIVHRDLKPENVIVEERDGTLHARVLDFGIARGAEPAAAASPEGGGKPLTRVGAILGTPGYMPPEQALGDTVDHRADLYALGVIVWELAAGRSLFGGRDLREIALAQMTEPVPAVEGAPAELQALLDALLEAKRENRPASATEVRDKLRRVAASAAAPAPVSLGSADTAPAPAPRLPTTNEAETPPPVATTNDPAPAGAQAVGSVVRPPPGSPAPAGGDRRRLAAAAIVGSILLVALGVALSGDGELDDVPEALRADAEIVLHGEDATSRVGAAARLQPSSATLPPVVRDLARYELARTCEARRDAVRAVSADGDPRALPALARIEASPRDGCDGGRADCLACLRGDVEEAIRALGGMPAASPAAETSDPSGDGDADASGTETSERRAPSSGRRAPASEGEAPADPVTETERAPAERARGHGHRRGRHHH